MKILRTLLNIGSVIIIILMYHYRGSAHRDCNINVELNHKIPVVFHNLKKYDSHLIMQEIGKFNVIPNGLEKYMRFSIKNKLSFIDSFQFLSASLDSLVKFKRT